jgi:phenylpropionate dioxygenase-like ring-hydroxylating dioxygenase large terminal subunit
MSEPEETHGGLALSEYRYPTGWFCVSWSEDVAIGEVKALQYFGENLVCYRAESGQVHVLDAHCLHLGGHMGVGGRVEGERIVCPWHAWRWNPDGTNAEIPYSRQKCKPNLRIHSWHACDWHGMVMVWHDRHRRPPSWELPRVPETEGDDYYPLDPSRVVHRIRAHPQMIMENAADPYHIPPVHHGMAPQTLSFNTYDHRIEATIETVYGGGKGPTWLTPEGPVTAKVDYDVYGIGLGFVRFPPNPLAAVEITSQTPVDEDHTDYWFMMTCRREPGDAGDVPTGRAEKFLRAQQQLITEDFFLWENMKYLPSPAFTPEEARDYVAFRRWAEQFYPPAELDPEDS